MLGENGALAGMDSGSVFVDHTTASAWWRESSPRKRLNVRSVVDAPVSGGQSGAENGCLTVLCGGTNADVSAAEPVMRAYAAQITHFGAVGSGQLAKMVNQICIAGCVQGLAEGLAFGMHAGLDMPNSSRRSPAAQHPLGR